MNRPTKEMARSVAELAGRLVAEREISKGASAAHLHHQVTAVVLLLIDPGPAVNREAYASDLAYAIIASVGR